MRCRSESGAERGQQSADMCHLSRFPRKEAQEEAADVMASQPLPVAVEAQTW